MGYYDSKNFIYYDDLTDICLVCKCDTIDHGYNNEDGHPFITDNLQFVEWKLKEKEMALA